MYKTLAEESVLYTKQGTINAVNAGARVKKLLQLVSGGVYDEMVLLSIFTKIDTNLLWT